VPRFASEETSEVLVSEASQNHSLQQIGINPLELAQFPEILGAMLLDQPGDVKRWTTSIARFSPFSLTHFVAERAKRFGIFLIRQRSERLGGFRYDDSCSSRLPLGDSLASREP